MASISFESIGSFNSVAGGSKVLDNPTSLQFGPDGRLYVAEQNGTINAFTVEVVEGEYIATQQEELSLPDGREVVKSIQNHNDDGSLNDALNRQVTGLIVTGTAENPVLYVSSSDPRISQNGEVNLDTNSGVVTQVTWTGNEWEAIDVVRGLPRSEENHSVNGLDLSADGSKLYLATGGNTNNGAPSQFFSYTGEYALSGTILEIDLADINSRPVLTDPAGGQNGTARQYVYDLPTLDDPTVDNVTDGVGEDEFGMDEAGPWGGNDGFNMSILPADAPLRIYADGFRNHYDVVVAESGQIYTVDNGSNGKLGGNPLVVGGEVTSEPNDGGSGDPEPLFLVEEGGYYGHPTPSRANQDLPWTVYDDGGNPDPDLPLNSVPDLAALVPAGIDIAEGFLVDPSKFTADPARLAQTGVRIERDSPESNALGTLGSSSNGLVEYTATAFDGALQNALVVTQFNGNVTLLNLNDAGTALEPLVGPGEDGFLGTDDDEVIDEDGIFPLVSGQTQALDVTVGPHGTIWVAEFGPDNINVFIPSDTVLPGDPDFDDDGILNVDDPFIRDASNGTSTVLEPGQTLLWDFDANQDNNLPGPDGYGGGLTGVMIDGATDYEQFFQEPSDLPGQLVKLDNVKFTTAAGGGTTVIENVSNGNPFENKNSGEYLFHTGVAIAPTTDKFNIKWTTFNPASEFTGSFQQIGGYIGTGDQSSYLKIVALQSSNGEIKVMLEDGDEIVSSSFIQADDLFSVPDNQQIEFELAIDPTAATAIPTVTYGTGGGNAETVAGESLDLSGTDVLDAILGNYTVAGQSSGLAVGLFSSNDGQPESNAFQATFDSIEITAIDEPDPFLFSLKNNPGLADLETDTLDIIQFNGSDFSVFFDGSDVGLNDDNVDVDAFDVISDTVILMSFNKAVNIDGLGTVDDSDIVKFTADSLGTNTAGSFSLYFDGSDVGLSNNGEDVDALVGLPDGSLLISTRGNTNASGFTAADDDVTLFTPSSTGDNTAGTFTQFIDGSDIGLTSEDIDALATNIDGSLNLSATRDITAGGVAAADEDVFGFTPTTTGNSTTGSFDSELVFDGSQFGLANNDIGGMDFTFGAS